MGMISDELKKEELFSAVLDASGISYWIYDIKEHTVELSDLIRNRIGISSNRIENMPQAWFDRNLVPMEYYDAYMQMIQDVEQGEQEAHMEMAIRNKSDGQLHWYKVAYTVIEMEDGKPAKALGVNSDITVQIQTRQSYESELQIRNELLKEAAIYFMANLTTHEILERRFPFPVDDGIAMPCPFTVKSWDANLTNTTLKEYSQDMVDHFSVEALLKAYQEGRSVIKYEYFKVSPMFSTHWFSAQASIVKQPETDHIIVLIYITDRDAECKQKMALKSILDEEIEFTVLIHADSKRGRLITAANELDVASYVQEYDYDEAIETLVVHRIALEDQEYCRNAFALENVKKELDKQKYYVITYNHQPENGKTYRKQVRAYYMDEYKEDIIFSRRDITDIYEEEIKHQEELKEALDLAERASMAKTTFLSQMSHEIRTPMNAIIGMSHLAEDTDMSPETRAYLKQIENSSHYLLDVINDILDMSRIESGRFELHPEWTSANTMLTTCMNMLGNEMKQKGIHFIGPKEDHDSGVEFYIDPLRAKQILMNLLNNAIKFTPTGGTIAMEIETEDIDESHRIDHVTISDTGCGMSQEFMQRIFQPFEQEQNPYSGQVQGTGLGLALVKKILLAMGGDITVSSELGNGSQFMYRLPYEYRRSDALKKPVRKRKKVDFNGMHILLVDDHPLNRKIARKLLERKGMLVEEAENGQEAVTAFYAAVPNYYDAILMDIRMPVMDGLEAAEKIRSFSKKGAKEVPIIAMTANAFDNDVKSSLKAGMNDHLAKPIDTDILYETLAKWV